MPRTTPGRRSAVGMSVAITSTGEREAHASPTAPSVLAAPGPGGRQRDAELAGRARVAVGGVGRGLLVANADQPDRRLAQRLPEREVVHAGQAEAPPRRPRARAASTITFAPVDMTLTVPTQVPRGTADRGSVARLPHVVFGVLFAGLRRLRRDRRCDPAHGVQLIAVTMLAFATVRRPEARIAWSLLTSRTARGRSATSIPSALSLLFLVSFAFAQIGLVTLAATQLRSRWLALDGVIVGLAAAAILTAYVSDSLVGLGLRVPATALAGDAMLVTTIALAFVVNGWRPARAWWIIALGELCLVVNDLTLTNPLAPPRTALLAWSAALLLTSYAAFHPGSPRARRVPGLVAAGVPIAGGAICVGLLMHAALTHGNPVTVWLAGAALVVGLVRAAFLLRENHKLVRESHARRR